MQDTEKTQVTFRFWEGEVIAVFPYLFEDFVNPNFVMSYQHIGQHCGADYDYIIFSSRPATPEEYANLKAELEDVVGYNLEIVHRRVTSKVDKLFQSFKFEMREIEPIN